MTKLIKLSACFIAILFVVNISFAQKKTGFSVIQIPAPSLKNNLVGTKDVQKIGIYLPPSYQTSKKSYPVVYFLTGYTVQAGQYPPTSWIDSIMDNKLVQEMIYVEISGYNMFKGTMYTNSEVTGNWEDFVVKDVVNYIDKNYRTLAKRESRGIAGHSMGGGGTVNISMKHPEVFSVAYAMSPAIAPHDSLMIEMFGDKRVMTILTELSKVMANVPKEEFAKKLATELDKYDGGMNWVLGYGTAFAPDLSQPLKMALPFEYTNSGELKKIEKNWNLWEKGFGGLEEKVKKYKNNLLAYRHYSIDCGYSDAIKWILAGTYYYSKLMTDENIPHSLHLYDGDHVNRVGKQMANRVMPIMSTYLARE